MIIEMKKTVCRTLVAGALVLAVSGTAQAGHGGSPQAIQNAIAANSVDAIQAELERAEYLVCAACTGAVLPLVDHLDYRVRRVAAWWLVRRATARQVYVDMLNRLAQPDSLKARNAADVLGEFGYPSSIPALGAALSNPIFSGEARAAMAQALGSIGRAEGGQPLVDALAVPGQDPMVSAAALTALRNIEGFRGTTLFAGGAVAVPSLSDPDAQVRGAAATTLGMLHASSTDVAAALVKALSSDPSDAVRKHAAWALGAVSAPASIAGPALQAAASSDTSPFVRSLAQASISKLTR
jgi:HEAT repeat protein